MFLIISALFITSVATFPLTHNNLEYTAERPPAQEQATLGTLWQEYENWPFVGPSSNEDDSQYKYFVQRSNEDIFPDLETDQIENPDLQPDNSNGEPENELNEDLTSNQNGYTSSLPIYEGMSSYLLPGAIGGGATAAAIGGSGLRPGSGIGTGSGSLKTTISPELESKIKELGDYLTSDSTGPGVAAAGAAGVGAGAGAGFIGSRIGSSPASSGPGPANTTTQQSSPDFSQSEVPVAAGAGAAGGAGAAVASNSNPLPLQKTGTTPAPSNLMDTVSQISEQMDGLKASMSSNFGFGLLTSVGAAATVFGIVYVSQKRVKSTISEEMGKVNKMVGELHEDLKKDKEEPKPPVVEKPRLADIFPPPEVKPPEPEPQPPPPEEPQPVVEEKVEPPPPPPPAPVEPEPVVEEPAVEKKTDEVQAPPPIPEPQPVVVPPPPPPAPEPEPPKPPEPELPKVEPPPPPEPPKKKRQIVERDMLAMKLQVSSDEDEPPKPPPPPPKKVTESDMLAIKLQASSDEEEDKAPTPPPAPAPPPPSVPAPAPAPQAALTTPLPTTPDPKHEEHREGHFPFRIGAGLPPIGGRGHLSPRGRGDRSPSPSGRGGPHSPHEHVHDHLPDLPKHDFPGRSSSPDIQRGFGLRRPSRSLKSFIPTGGGAPGSPPAGPPGPGHAGPHGQELPGRHSPAHIAAGIVKKFRET